MGNFGGHALPGTFFIIFAVWWTIQMFRRYFASQRKGGLPFKSTVTYPLDFAICCPAWLRRWEWEGFLKIFFTVVGFTGEVITAHKDGRFVHMGNGQHATMFFVFGLTGVVDILVHHRAPLPEGIEYLCGVMAFVVEAVLFMFHLHGRSEFDIAVHTLLLYDVYFCVIITVIEMRYRHSIVVALSRCYVVFIQGTWFWQVAFLLYNPLPGAVPWEPNNHDQIMVATMIFAWHMAAVFIVMATIGAVVAAVQSRWCWNDDVGGGSGRRYDGMQLLKQSGDQLDSDSEDVDFERAQQNLVGANSV